MALGFSQFSNRYRHGRWQVGVGLPFYLKWSEVRRRKAGKEAHSDDENIPLKSRNVGAFVFVMYYLLPIVYYLFFSICHVLRIY